jgi:hypothetical protein
MDRAFVVWHGLSLCPMLEHNVKKAIEHSEQSPARLL